MENVHCCLPAVTHVCRTRNVSTDANCYTNAVLSVDSFMNVCVCIAYDLVCLYFDPSTPPGEVLQRMRHHSRPVRCVNMSEEGSLLVCGSDDCTVSLWKLTAPEVVTDGGATGMDSTGAGASGVCVLLKSALHYDPLLFQ
jgi:WD40 repeat protein